MSASLYDRLGGAEGIARIADDIIAAHLANPLIQTRFQNIQDLEHARQMAREFFAAVRAGLDGLGIRHVVSPPSLPLPPRFPAAAAEDGLSSPGYKKI